MKQRIILLIASSMLPLTGMAQTEDAYQRFQQALGEPAWIGLGQDHEMTDAMTRPRPALSTLPLSADKQRLGFDLFHETGLSADGTVACNSCHMGMLGGGDARPTSIGIGGAVGTRNSPSVLNAAFNFRQFWDGRSQTLSDQALEPLANPIEMGHDVANAVNFLKSDENYAQQFAAIYPDGVTAANLGDALSQHVKAMTRTDSRFNAYLNGDETALSEQEQRGYQRFNEIGCTACHNGINLGGSSYQSASLISSYRPADPGLAARSERFEDQGVFKVPSLHNVALTAPYFHDGSVRDLPSAVTTMALMTTGRQLSTADRDDIVAFLGSLSSEFFASRGGMGGMNGMQGGMGRGMQGGMHGSGGMQHQMNHGGGMQGGGMHDGGMHGQGMQGRGMQGGGMRGEGMQGRGMQGGGMHQNDQPMAQAFLAEIDELGNQTGNARNLSGDHQQDYQQVLGQSEHHSEAIAQEMQRILDGSIVHYDYLQFEYSELLKALNALSHPPASLQEDEQRQRVNNAAAYLEKAQSMEWIISDFLRAIATVRVAEANLQDQQAEPASPSRDQQIAALQAMLAETAGQPEAAIAQITALNLAADIHAW